MAADRQATVRISADGSQVIVTYEKIGKSAEEAGRRVKAANEVAASSGGKVAQSLNNVFDTAKKNVGNLSFQLQDVAVQLQSGTSPLTVLLQQGTQIASIFGPAGAIVGAVGAGLGLMAGFLFDAGDEAEKATEKTDSFRDALSFLGETAGSTAGEIAKLAKEYRNASAELQQLTLLNLDKEQRELQGQIQTARASGAAELDRLRRPQTFTLGKFGTVTQDMIPEEDLAVIERFAKGGSLLEAVQQLDALAKRAQAAGNTELRSVADGLLAIATDAAKAQAQLEKTADTMVALQGVTGENSQGFPVSVPRQFGRAEAPSSPRTGSRPRRTPGEVEADQLRRRAEALITQSLTPLEEYRAKLEEVDQLLAKHALTQEEAAKVRLNLAAEMAEQQKKIDDQAFQRIQQQAIERDRIAKEEARLKREDPAGYYRRTGDTDFAAVYDPLTGAADAFRKLSDESQQYGRIIGDSIAGGAQVASQAISAFVLEGKSGIKDLAKTVADQLLTGALSIFINGIVGGAGGALTNYFSGTTAPGSTGASPLTYGGPRAGGGRVGSDRWYWVGENGPERFVPDRAGRIEPMSGGGGATVINQVIDQRQAGAPAVEQSQSRGPNGETILRTIIRDEVPKMVAAGKLDGAFKNRFGNRPRPQR